VITFIKIVSTKLSSYEKLRTADGVIFSRTKYNALKYLSEIHLDKSIRCVIQLNKLWRKNDVSANKRLFSNGKKRVRFH